MEVGARGGERFDVRALHRHYAGVGTHTGTDTDAHTHIEADTQGRSEEHTSELQSPDHLVCRLLLEKKKKDQLESARQLRNSTTRPPTQPVRMNRTSTG